jgi:hypothetical protein
MGDERLVMRINKTCKRATESFLTEFRKKARRRLKMMKYDFKKGNPQMDFVKFASSGTQISQIKSN